MALPNATLTLEQGNRYSWASPTTDVRALEYPSASPPRERRATSWFDVTQLRLRLDFTTAYTGILHVYTYDWDSNERRQTITVNDGTTSTTNPLTKTYNAGAWIHVPISVGAGGSVHITDDWVSGWPATIAGIFLGGAGTPPAPTPTPPPPPVPLPEYQGNWPGNVGVDGYALGAFNGPGTSDLVSLPNATLTLEQGNRYSWVSPTTDIRALVAPTGTERRATSWYDVTQLRLRLDFSTAYDGTLHVYTYDWDSNERRQTITVNDGTTTKSIPLVSTYNAGAWLHFPIHVGAGGSVLITDDWVSGWPATIAGIFLGGGAVVPPPTVPAAPVLTATAGVGQVGLAWTTPADGGSQISGYTVFRGTVSGTLSAYQTLGVVSSYTDTAVTNGTPYYYTVAARNGVGTGPQSAERSATPTAPPPTVPAAPVLTATAGVGKVDLGWTTPADGGSMISGYTIFRGTVSGTLSAYQTLGVTSAYSDTAVTAGTTYYYTVAAINGVGTGATVGRTLGDAAHRPRPAGPDRDRRRQPGRPVVDRTVEWRQRDHRVQGVSRHRVRHPEPLSDAGRRDHLHRHRRHRRDDLLLHGLSRQRRWGRRQIGRTIGHTHRATDRPRPTGPDRDGRRQPGRPVVDGTRQRR